MSLAMLLWYLPGGQMVHAVFPAALNLPAAHEAHAEAADAVEYFPEEHTVHALAPVPVPVFVIEPGLQEMQAVLPCTFWYWPAGQLMQEATFDAVEYFPVAHFEQVFAPVLVPVLVIDPAGQAMHPVAPLMSPV